MSTGVGVGREIAQADDHPSLIALKRVERASPREYVGGFN